jgi:hypothetical protein
MGRSPRGAAQLEARFHGARGDPPGDAAGAGQAAWMAYRGGRRGRKTWGEYSVSRASSRSAGERGHGLNYARRQQYRRLSRAGRAAAGSVVAALLALVVWGAGAGPLAGMLLLLAVGRGLYARHWLALAGRSRVGARSEDDVQRALAPLRSEGWQLRHSLRWRGRGDIDSVAISPRGIAVAIETKTRTYDGRHLARVRKQAAWLSRHRRKWARNGALGVMCLVRARGVERVEHDVLVVSIDRLTHVLRVAAGTRPHAPSGG